MSFKLLVSIIVLFCDFLSGPEYVQIMPNFYPAIKMKQNQLLNCEIGIEIFCSLIQRFISIMKSMCVCFSFPLSGLQLCVAICLNLKVYKTKSGMVISSRYVLVGFGVF